MPGAGLRDPVAGSRQLSWLLRHGASEVGLAMDPAGWADVAAVLAYTRLTRAQLELIVRTNDKGRLQLDGDRVRACQGHSTANLAIDRDALEASWQPHAGDAWLWHGTTREALDAIAREGLRPVARTHVHLAEDPTSTVGKRASVAWLLAIDPVGLRAAGHAVFVAPNGVRLVRAVPPSCIVGARAMTRRAAAQQAEVLALLAVPAV